MTEKGPAHPKSILRGHKTSVHAAAFIRGNERLLTGDSDGFVIVWDLTILRPRAVWQAHNGAILGFSSWGPDRIITHGRDNKLIVWKLGVADESALSTTLPLDSSPEPRPKPWILYMLSINTMNFCSFSHCPASPHDADPTPDLLVAVPNTLFSEAVDIFHLPTQERRHTIRLEDKGGMVMALALLHLHSTLTLAAGYENGVVATAQLPPGTTGWTTTYHVQPHSQPVLSLSLSPRHDYFLTSSADALLIKHPLPSPGCVLSADTTTKTATIADDPTSAILGPKPQTTTTTTVQAPLAVLNTRHAGQQALAVRSDGRIFATAGWDARVRVYAPQGAMREVAVLKWHQAGCYALAVADVGPPPSPSSGGQAGGEAGEGAGSSVVMVKGKGELSVREKRVRQAKEGHWIAAGSKDGKVSLWDIY
ncbi:WD repeat-containing protein [Schizothecium vesticola]|uniref:ASTRA-associated protein 1 n=1 Tax=Schizothecium vesticola TaxID=314040 RepID=A0AA40EWA2_9PEZI|nr:WD repeat-containing protein [Schizothecium vesticola]